MAEPFKKSWVRDTFESLVVTVILALFGTSFVVQAFQIPTGSMENTLLIGDHLLVSKFAYGGYRGFKIPGLAYRDIRRGDIVVFRFPDDPSEYFVKRVVGLPGDRIRIATRVVYVNDVPLDEPYVQHLYLNQVRSGDNFPPAFPELLRGMTREWSAELPTHVADGELVVPPGNFFVMGDNREQSLDSRFWGFVPQEYMSGRPFIIYVSFDRTRDDYQDDSTGGRFRRIFGLIADLPSKLRWKRTFHVVR